MDKNSIELEAIRGSGSARYRVWWRGQILLQLSRDPEHDAARALLALGVTGSLTTFWPGSKIPAMRLVIETAACRTTKEGNARPRIARWEQFPTSNRRAHQQSYPVERQSAKRNVASVTLAEI